jgi:hypothetical protein
MRLIDSNDLTPPTLLDDIPITFPPVPTSFPPTVAVGTSSPDRITRTRGVSFEGTSDKDTTELMILVHIDDKKSFDMVSSTTPIQTPLSNKSKAGAHSLDTPITSFPIDYCTSILIYIHTMTTISHGNPSLEVSSTVTVGSLLEQDSTTSGLPSARDSLAL